MQRFLFLCCTIAKMPCILGRIDVENISGTNFKLWRLNMEDLLIDQDLWDVIDKNNLRPTYPTLAI